MALGGSDFLQPLRTCHQLLLSPLLSEKSACESISCHQSWPQRKDTLKLFSNSAAPLNSAIFYCFVNRKMLIF